MNFYRQVGELILGTRLKRLSERFLSDVSKVYKQEGISFEPSWFPFFYLLNQKKESTLRAISDELEISHSAVSQLVGALEKKKLVKVITDENDKRQRLVCFTKEGEALLSQVKPIWDSIARGMEQILSKGHYSHYLIPAVDELEESMANEGVFHSIRQALSDGRVQSVSLRKLELSEAGFFEDLVKGWQREFPDHMVYPIHLLGDWKENPENTGVLLAELEGEAVGYIQYHNHGEYSGLTCLYVNTAQRRRRVASALLEFWQEYLKNNTSVKALEAKVSKKSVVERFLLSSGFIRQIPKNELSQKERLAATVELVKEL